MNIVYGWAMGDGRYMSDLGEIDTNADMGRGPFPVLPLINAAAFDASPDEGLEVSEGMWLRRGPADDSAVLTKDSVTAFYNLHELRWSDLVNDTRMNSGFSGAYIAELVGSE